MCAWCYIISETKCVHRGFSAPGIFVTCVHHGGSKIENFTKGSPSDTMNCSHHSIGALCTDVHWVVELQIPAVRCPCTHGTRVQRSYGGAGESDSVLQSAQPGEEVCDGSPPPLLVVAGHMPQRQRCGVGKELHTPICGRRLSDSFFEMHVLRKVYKVLQWRGRNCYCEGHIVVVEFCNRELGYLSKPSAVSLQPVQR